MVEIIPAIMPKSYNELRDKVSQVVHFVDYVQVDLMDGKYINNTTWPFFDKDQRDLLKILQEEEGLPYWDKINYEFDLMVVDATLGIDNFIKLGASRLVFHLSTSEGDLQDFKEFLEGIDLYIRDTVQIGVAINLDADITKIEGIINQADFIQCMGIAKVGFQGEPFDERVLKQVNDLRNNYPDLIISVDGGIDLSIAPDLIKAGANRLVIGSAIYKSVNIGDTIEQFKEL
jgi:ribulose-phosphate 3-epimerase